MKSLSENDEDNDEDYGEYKWTDFLWGNCYLWFDVKDEDEDKEDNCKVDQY